MMLRAWHLTQRWLCGQKLEEETSEDTRLVFCPSVLEAGSRKGFCSPAFLQLVSCHSRSMQWPPGLIFDAVVGTFVSGLSPGFYYFVAWVYALLYISYRGQWCRPVLGV